MIFSIFNQKGGVGKSTLATCLADVLSYSATTCLVDLDKQGTITQAAALDSFPVAVREVEDVAEIPNLPEKITIVDCPPYLVAAQTKALLKLSDFILVPIKPGFADYFALHNTLEYIRESGSRAAVVLNMVKPGNKLTEQVRGMVEKMEVPILKTTIGDRVAYTRALVAGSVYDTDTKAADEINRLIIEIYNIITD